MALKRFETKPKIEISVLDQDILFKEWDKQPVNTIRNSVLEEGVIICRNAIFGKNGRTDDLYLAFQCREDGIRFEEVYGSTGKVACVWTMPYRGYIKDGVKVYGLKFEPKYGVHRKRMHTITGTFLAIMRYLNVQVATKAKDNISARIEEYPMFRKQGDGTEIPYYLEVVEYKIEKVAPLEPRGQLSDNVEEVLWFEREPVTQAVIS